MLKALKIVGKNTENLSFATGNLRCAERSQVESLNRGDLRF